MQKDKQKSSCLLLRQTFERTKLQKCETIHSVENSYFIENVNVMHLLLIYFSSVLISNMVKIGQQSYLGSSIFMWRGPETKKFEKQLL